MDGGMDNREDCEFFLRFFFLFLVKAYLIKYWDFENSSLTFETE